MCCQFFDEKWMRYAIMFADLSEYYGEVSVGAVLILNGYIIGWGWNSVISLHDPTAHAEVVALRKGGRVIGNYRLLRTTLYVTLEPCIMCFGAMLHARVFRLVFGARSKHGVVVSQKNYLHNCIFNHHIICTGDILKGLCSDQITNFFYRIRLKKLLMNKII